MGLYQQEICIFTGLKTQPFIDSRDAIEYHVTIGSKRHFIRLPYYASQWQSKDSFFQEHKNLLAALLLNDKWFSDETIYIKIDNLKELISKADIPRTPQQKLEFLFLSLFSLQKEDGQLINLNLNYYENTYWKILYFKSKNELEYYIRYLDRTGLINAYFINAGNEEVLTSLAITFEGLEKAIKLQEEGEHSDKCFIAMSFKEETNPIRDAIKSALIKTGFTPIIIDEQNIDSERTINDAIIANLKKCKFCIADFSFHSNGVYFESGFALGQGKKVIYTCNNDEFKNAHFDIKPLQHIIYRTVDQLEMDLINKIEAWIK